MPKIRFTEVPPGGAPLEVRESLLGVAVRAEAVAVSDSRRPNTRGRAYEVDSDELARALRESGKSRAAEFYGAVNQFPALQRIGLLFPTACAEAA